MTKCAHIFCRQCISQELERDDYICCPNTDCDTILQLQSIYSWSSLTSAQSDFSGEALPTSSSVVQTNTSSKINAVIKTILALPMVTNIDQDRFRRQNNASLSRKKALVFSQWTKMLDLLEISLSREGICYRRLDGTMSTQARERALSEFKTLPEVIAYSAFQVEKKIMFILVELLTCVHSFTNTLFFLYIFVFSVRSLFHQMHYQFCVHYN